MAGAIRHEIQRRTLFHSWRSSSTTLITPEHVICFLAMRLGRLLSLLPLSVYLASTLPTSQSPLQNGDRSISPNLYAEMEELSRIVDISYCIGLTGIGISKPFQCASRCRDFENFELVKVHKNLLDPPVYTSEILMPSLGCRHGTPDPSSLIAVAISRSPTDPRPRVSSSPSAVLTASPTPLPICPLYRRNTRPILVVTAHHPGIRTKLQSVPTAQCTPASTLPGSTHALPSSKRSNRPYKSTPTTL